MTGWLVALALRLEDCRCRSRVRARTRGPTLPGTVTLLRGATRVLYRIGGEDGSRRAASSVVMTDLAGLRSHQVRLRGPLPGRIVAGALHAWQPAALVLERREHGARDHRLIWVELETGHSRLLTSFPGLRGVFDRYDVLALGDGSFALVASSTTLDRHVVVLLDVGRRGVSATRFGTAGGRVVARPYATERGVSLPVSVGGAPWQPVGTAFHALRRATGRELADCF